jgi:hypothetical protein
MFTENGPAIVAEIDGGPLSVDQAALASMTAHAAGCRRPLPGGLPAGYRRGGRGHPQQPQAHGRGGHLINPADPAVLRFLEELFR